VEATVIPRASVSHFHQWYQSHAMMLDRHYHSQIEHDHREMPH
jgi:hypothetical protein